MHRVGLPKVAILPTNKKIKLPHKPVKVVEKGEERKALLIPYKDFNNIINLQRELEVSDFFTLDEQRFVIHHKFNGPKQSKEKLNQRLKKDREDYAKKSDFYIYDIKENSYWTKL